jgi:hypothetical protein
MDELLEVSLRTPIHRCEPFSPRQVHTFPLVSELHLDAWQRYLAEAARRNAWEVLQEKLVQLQFPIRPGISQTAVYRAATKQGLDVSGRAEASGLVLEQPAALQLKIHQSLAGAVPVLLPATRADFCSLVQALSKQNEPMPIPDSMGACMVAGYNNWDRLHTCRRQWLAGDPRRTPEGWPQAFRELVPQKPLYQDRFIILSQGFYSDVPADPLELDWQTWLSLSGQIRLAHECAHYLTKRLFGVVRRHLHDELLADYAGIVAAIGRYRADWFLRFMGLEAYPAYRVGGRLENYLDPAGQQEPIFTQVKAMLVAAAYNLERFDRSLTPQQRLPNQQGAILCALAGTSLVDLAAAGGDKVLAESVRAWQTAVSAAGPKKSFLLNEEPDASPGLIPV